MNPLILAKEIIDGRRITREDDLSFFLTCDLDELCEGADRIREVYIGDKVGSLFYQSMDAAADVRRTANIVHSQYTTILPAKSMIFFRRKRFWKHVKMNEEEGVDRFFHCHCRKGSDRKRI